MHKQGLGKFRDEKKMPQLSQCGKPPEFHKTLGILRMEGCLVAVVPNESAFVKNPHGRVENDKLSENCNGIGEKWCLGDGCTKPDRNSRSISCSSFNAVCGPCFCGACRQASSGGVERAANGPFETFIKGADGDTKMKLGGLVSGKSHACSCMYRSCRQASSVGA